MVSFIRKDFPGVYTGTDKELKRELEWYRNREQMVELKDRGKLVGILTGNVVNSLSFYAKKEFPQDDFQNGTILWAPLAVIKKPYRRKGLLRGVLLKVLIQAPQLRYVAFQRADRGFEVTVKSLNHMLGVPEHEKLSV